MKHSLFIMSLFSLLFSITVKANQYSQLHFMSKGEEVSLYYTGNYYNPRSVTFNFECNSSYCDFYTRAKEVMKDFIRAVQQDKIYRYRLVIACDHDGPCDHINSEPHASDDAQDSLYNTSRINKIKNRAKNMADEAIRGASNQVGSNSVDKIFEFFDDDNVSDAAEKTEFFVAKAHGKPVGLCEMKNGECDFVDEVVFANPGGGVAVGMTVDPGTSFRFSSMQTSLQEFMIRLSQRLNLECQTVGTGVNGDLKWRMVCYYRN